MRGYGEQLVFSADQKADLRDATAIVGRLPEKQEDDDWVRCHELVRAVAPSLGNRWHVVDGQVAAVEHTWLVWRGKGHVVLDLYVPAELPQVQLVDCNPLWRRGEYRPGPHRRDIRDAVVDWLRTRA